MTSHDENRLISSVHISDTSKTLMESDNNLRLARIEDPLNVLLMAPPVGLPMRKKYKSNKIILAEDEYIDKISDIIERDYYPNISRLKQRLDGDISDISDISSSQGHYLKSKDDDSDINHRISHKPRLDRDIYETSSSSSQYLDSKDEDHDVSHSMSLNDFLSHHISEDNHSFQEILIKDTMKRQRLYHWAYDQQKLLLSDGSVGKDDENTALTISKLLTNHHNDQQHNFKLFQIGDKLLSNEDRSKFDLYNNNQVVKYDDAMNDGDPLLSSDPTGF